MATKRKTAINTTASSALMVGNIGDDSYRSILNGFRSHALARIAAGPVFTTDASDLFDAYLGAFSARERQHHTCSACRRFIENYGGLVTIAVDGSVEPVFWPSAADWIGDYAAPVAALRERVKKAKVDGVFLSKDTAWGQAVTGTWCHFAVTLPTPLARRSRALTPGQEMAERREDYATVSRALSEWSMEVLNAGVRLLDSDALYRSEKLFGAATWLRDLAVARKADKRNASAMLWRAIGTAPAGFCHPRSGMLGTLLDDLASGSDFAGVSRRFSEKMHPLRYQRPTAAPSAGTISQAEKLVESLGLARSFERRFARPDDVTEWIWLPRAEVAKPSGGMFAHLKAKGEQPISVSVPETSMSWAVFSRDVLPRVSTLHAYVPSQAGFVTLVTAEHVDAPPIFQWDRDEARNPMSWYVWHGGSPASQYGLAGGSYVPVVGLCPSPHQWHGAKSDHFPNGVLVLLEGARETRNLNAALFPETLKSDLHGVRSVVEAHSRSQKIVDRGDHGGGTGLLISAKGDGVKLRVSLDGVTSTYKIDRLE